MGNRSISCLASLTALAFLLAGGAIGLAQEKERPKLKNFGSSLKRLRRDDQKKTGVDLKSKSTANPGDEIDVVKVETSLVTSDVLVLDARGNPVPGPCRAQVWIASSLRSSQ